MHELVIVGAGPAGMASAVAAADAGVRVLVVDEQARAGGQIFRRPPAEFQLPQGNFAPYRWAGELIERFESHPAIETRFRSTAFGVLRDRPTGEAETTNAPAQLQLAVRGQNGGELLATQRLLIATGAYDMPVAFPGWSMPGVMMAGAVQSLLKSQKVLAGRNLVLAGSHPLLLVVAEQMLAAGAKVSEIAFARGIPSIAELAAALPAAPGHLGIFAEAAKAMASIVKHGVRLSTRTVVTAAHGNGSVSRVELSKVDAKWRPRGKSRELETDLLVLGYGFTPSTELARQAGCAVEWNSAKGGWVISHDAAMRTSAPDIWVAGEPGGVAGAEHSRWQGELAGLHIAQSLDRAVPAERFTRAEQGLRTAQRFARVVQSMFEPQREALATLSAPAHTVVCRCELVESAEVDQVLEANPFISSANALKLECRTGMGPCQGRYCEGTVAARVAAAREISIESAGHFTAHLPVKPVPVDTYRGLSTDS